MLCDFCEKKTVLNFDDISKPNFVWKQSVGKKKCNRLKTDAAFGIYLLV